jgi:cell wall-associated NlpC family hydrolase
METNKMNWNKLLIILVTFSLFGIIEANAQNIQKIEKKLNKTYQHGNMDKLTKQASKLKKKYPRIDAPNYYLAKAEMVKFNQVTNLPNKKQYNYLRKASTYSKNLGNNYSFWQDSITNYYIEYINSWNDEGFDSPHLKKVVSAYSKTFNDTLPEYYSYFGQANLYVKLPAHAIPETSPLRAELITYASDLVGIGYHYGGEKPEDGFDCSGFVKYVYASIGVELPHNAHMISQIEGETIALEDAEPGDLIFFGSGNTKKWKTQHAGIIYEYENNEPKIIHCPSRGVTIDGNNSSWDYYWKEKVLFVKRLPQLEE